MIVARTRVRVVHLVRSLQVGGLERVVLDLARHADAQTFDPCVLCLQDGGPLRERFEALGVAVHSLDLRELRKGPTLLRLVRWLRQAQPQVLHTHNPTPHLFGALAAWPAGVPVLVHTKHGRNYPESRRAVAWNRLASWFSDRVVPVSADSAEVARQIERVPPRKVQVILNGIDLADFPAPAGPRPKPGKRVVHVARLIDVTKDQTTLLRAARLVADREPDFRLTIVGDGPDRAPLTALAADLGLQGHVHFLGYRSDVAALLGSADLFVLSSLSEGISLTLLEAMAAGLPVVATAIGGNREVVVPGQTGLLVPARSPAALAEALLALLRGPEQARRMGIAGRRRVEEQFSLGRMVAQYEDLYLSLLRGRGARDPAGRDGATRVRRSIQV
jgi:sugar transferase (PEP-CTERM/EpsH1 system associated)